MEGNALQEFLDWGASVKLLDKVKFVICDQDSSTHKLIQDDSRCKHMTVLFDPGHYKKCFQKKLIKLFGTKKRFQTFAARIAGWMMRALSEAKTLFPKNRNLIKIEFVRRMKYCADHYTNSLCNEGCPCLSIRLLPLSKVYLESTEACAIAPWFSYILTFCDSQALSVASMVCKHWQFLVENQLRTLEVKSKTIISLEDQDVISDLKVLIDDLISNAPLFSHVWHTCIVESSHNSCIAFGEKRVHYYSSFGGRTFCSYARFNLGWFWISRLYKKLGMKFICLFV
jgi:hypothetical protein